VKYPCERTTTLTPAKLSQCERFEAFYAQTDTPVMQKIGRRVCGCTYGASSWTTRAEADHISKRLDLRPGARLLDVGSGAGWPAVYLAKTTGCDVVLVDLPFGGLRIAGARAASDGLSGVCWLAVADAAVLPFCDASFDAINHSDLLCCLEDKRGALAACRRVLRRAGTMMFSVILVPQELFSKERRRGIENGPEFIDSDCDYPTLLEETGWSIVGRQDITAEYAATCQRQLDADVANAENLRALIGPAEYGDRVARWPEKLAVIAEDLLRRELFTVTPR